MTFERLQAEVYSILRRLRLLEYKGDKVEVIDVDSTVDSNSSSNIFLVDSTSENILVVIPNAEDIPDKPLTFKKLVSANSVYIQPVESQTIDGDINWELTAQYESITIVANSGNYYIISQV